MVDVLRHIEYDDVNHEIVILLTIAVKPVLSDHSKICFKYHLSLNARQNYCRMLQREHSAILSTFNKLPLSTKTFVLSILRGCFRQILL